QTVTDNHIDRRGENIPSFHIPAEIRQSGEQPVGSPEQISSLFGLFTDIQQTNRGLTNVHDLPAVDGPHLGKLQIGFTLELQTGPCIEKKSRAMNGGKDGTNGGSLHSLQFPKDQYRSGQKGSGIAGAYKS